MTVRVGIVGDPVDHSLSPEMHNAAFRELGLDWHYRAIRVSPREFEAQVRALVNDGYVGLNATIPHKVSALKLADHSTNTAQASGAANTLTFKHGQIFADNTDALGFLEALSAAGVSAFGDKTALVLGAGGTGRAATWSLLSQGIKRLYLWNRTAARTDRLANDLKLYIDTSRLTVVADPTPCIAGCDVVVNTTSVGLDASDADDRELRELRIPLESLHVGQVVVDFVYRQKQPTGLIKGALSQGARSIDGLELLVRQGARSFEIWTGLEAPVDVMRSAIQR